MLLVYISDFTTLVGLYDNILRISNQKIKIKNVGKFGFIVTENFCSLKYKLNSRKHRDM